MKPQELGCFEQVKGVLGELGAIEELQKVIDCEDYTSVLWDQDEELGIAFDWEATPQGSIFWMDVCDDKVPDGYVPPSEHDDVTDDRLGLIMEALQNLEDKIKEVADKIESKEKGTSGCNVGSPIIDDPAANDDVSEESEIVPWEPVRGEWNIEPEMVFEGGPYDSYCDFGLARCSREQAEKARDEMRVFNRLLAYRDEFDPDFDFEEAGGGYYVFVYDEEYDYKYDDYLNRNIGCVYMSEGVVEELCRKLNNGEVVL